MSYRVLGQQDMINLRVARVHTLEKTLAGVALEAEEIGGFTPDMEREVTDLERRIAVHADVLWPEQAHQPDHAEPGTGEPEQQLHEHDELGARRTAVEQADGPSPHDEVTTDPHAPLAPVLGHEEDDLPGAALDAEDDVPCDPGTGTDAPLGHVERDADVLALHPDDEHEGAHALSASGLDDHPGRHGVQYSRGRGAFDRVGAFDAWGDACPTLTA